jgi:transposase
LKLLETANIKLANVATDVFGVTGRLMLQALLQATTTPQEMADLAKGLLRKKIPELKLALEGKVEEHHRFLLGVQLRRLQPVEEDLASSNTTSKTSSSPTLQKCWCAICGRTLC